MKNNNFAAEYRNYKEIEARYYAARDAKNDAEVEAARTEARTLLDGIEGKGKDYARTYEEYKDAQEHGNDCIDLHDNIWDEHVEPLIERLRSFGIDRFTFSSTWSSAVKTAWLFTENGCRLEGLIQINGSWDPLEGEYEKVPAYLFSIQ